MRHIPSGVDCSDIASDARVTAMASRPKSARGSAEDHEKIPWHTKRPTGSGGSSLRAEATAAGEESESAKTPDEEEFSGAICHNEQLLPLSAILRNLSCHVQCCHSYGEIWNSDRSSHRCHYGRRRTPHS